MEIVQDFYVRAYRSLRRINHSRYIVMHDSFRLNEWEEFFKEHTFNNVILDTHMYQCFDKSNKGLSIDDHCDEAFTRKKRLARIEKFVPVIVGEWSLALPGKGKNNREDNPQKFKQYASAQLHAMSKCTGHIFWSYRVEQDRFAWHFRKLVENGVINMKEFLQ